MSFKEGDIVKVTDAIRPELFTRNMEIYIGKKATITGSCTVEDESETVYFIDIDNQTFLWGDEMLEPYQEPTIKDSGERTEYETGAVRDCKEGKGRCDLMPLDVVAKFFEKHSEGNTLPIKHIADFKKTGDIECLYNAIASFIITSYGNIYNAVLEVSKHFEDGAKKYGENNWQKGIPVHSYIDSAVRHYLKYMAGWEDEPHDRAFVWNIMCCIWTLENKPELNDLTK